MREAPHREPNYPGYRPQEKTAKILKWVLGKVEEVPYRVTLRWAFYRCVQELGLGLSKKDYNNFKKWIFRARKGFWGGWKPWTLAENARDVLPLSIGHETFRDWVKSLENIKPTYEKFSSQENFVMIWFGAEAMRSQFRHYADPYGIPLVSFRKDPSIDLKWKIVEYSVELEDKYGPKPIYILYFGDYEPDPKPGSMTKRMRTPQDVFEFVRSQFFDLLFQERPDIPPKRGLFNFVRCGLKQEHAEQWDLPENPDRPGEYQWEGLSDDQARELIVRSIEKFLNLSIMKKIERRERRDAERWKKMLEREATRSGF